jgi:CubicO group peptidase (beta-lactamase class C family)
MDKRNPADLGLSVDRLSQVKRVINEAIERREIAGAVVGVLRHGSLAYLEATGLRNLERELPMQEDTLFRIYSMTKPITSAAIMMLVEECRIGLHAPISRFLPGFREMEVYVGGNEPPFRTEDADREITLHDILTHTSGLGYGIGNEHPVEKTLERLWDRIAMKRDTSLREMAELIADVPLVEQPGTAWRYSAGIDVAGALVEEVSGQTLDRFIEERILEPLGMKNTWWTVPEDERDRLAVVYTDGEAGLVPVPDIPLMAFFEPHRSLNGGGGLVGTIEDYLRFCQMLLDGGYAPEAGRHILAPATVRMMMTDHVAPSIPRTELIGSGFGYGGRVVTDTRYYRQYASEGLFSWGGAASTEFFVSPADDLAMVFMTQRMPGFTSDVNGHVWLSVFQSLIS